MSQIVCPGCGDVLHEGEELCTKCEEETLTSDSRVLGVEAGEKSDTEDADQTADAQRENY